VERAYQRMAPVYDALFGWSLQLGRRQAMQRLSVKPGQATLEVGVGTGLALPLWPAHANVTGIDACPEMLARAEQLRQRRHLDHVTLLTMDAQNLAFPDNHFDGLAALYVVSVVPDPAALLRELVRVGRPGARVVIVNHFAHQRGWVRTLERAFAGATRWAGWDLELSSAVVHTTPGLRVLKESPANWLGYWTLIEAEVTAG
jgi:phosphatidylethanolamine/phosphatidyl-N-methylethanolamine N-methyltransferase